MLTKESDKVGFGRYVFKQIVSHADYTSGRTNLVFPSLIFELLKAQYPIHKPEESFTSLKHFQIVQQRFLKGNRLVDIQGETSNNDPSAHTTPPNDITPSNAT